VLTVLWLAEPAPLASIDPLLLEFVAHSKM
jgi:hypothetical protein